MEFPATKVVRRGDRLSIIADDMHEFRMHRKMCIDELSIDGKSHKRDRISRRWQPISRSICAMLNSHIDGRIYLGVDDDGRICGLLYSDDQRAHLLAAVHHLLKRYRPTVPTDTITITFIDVIDDDYRSLQSDQHHSQFEHLLECADCWCDELADANRDEQQRQLVAIDVRPRCDDRIYQNEEGICYRRVRGGNVRCTLNDVVQRIDDDVRHRFVDRRMMVEREIDRVAVANQCSVM